MIDVPCDPSLAYTFKIKECFKTHSCLPEHLKLYLQSHLSVLCKCFWLQSWPSSKVYRLCQSVAYIETKPWQHGIQNIIQTIEKNGHINKEEEDINDLSKGIFSQCGS